MDQRIDNSSYTAVLLAAGYGSRISNLTDGPKCLLEIDGRTLLERNFDIWKKLGIKNVNLVLGYKHELIEAIAKKYEDVFNFNISLNEDFRNFGNTYSLKLGIVDVPGPCLIFDADLIYDFEILNKFLDGRNSSEILIGIGDLDDIESSKALIDRNGFARMTVDKRAITKKELESFRFVGEAIGILKFNTSDTRALSSAADNFLKEKENQNLNWEHLLNEFLVKNDIGTSLFEEGRWIEIDNQEDFENAQNLFEQ